MGKLVFFCGKMGAGKSTKATAQTAQSNAVLLSEDVWLKTLYPTQIHSFADYLQYSSLLKPLLQEHVAQILRSGSHVVMDFPANTRKQRAWFKQLADSAQVEHEMFYLQLSDAQCLEQIAKRRLEQPDRAAFDTEAVFFEVSQYFEEPGSDEGLNISVISG